MRVETAYDGRAAVVRLDGRLDAECSVYLAAALEDVLRAGTRTAVVDLSAVRYVSSAGAEALTRSAREFAAIRGELFVTAPPPAVRLALAAAGLDDRILQTYGPVERGRISGALDLRGQQGRQTREWHAADLPSATIGHYEAVPRVAGATLACRLYGDPARLGAGSPDEAGDCHAVAFGERTFGLGLGALGETFEECRGRFGELLAAGGVLIHLPIDGAGVPDYLGTIGGSPPAAMLGAGLVCEGDFSHLVRFGTGGADPVPLRELAAVCLDFVGGDAAGVVMVAETAGLVGAWRRAAPAGAHRGRTAGNGDGESSFAPAALREWLTLTAEPMYAGTTALVVGVVARRAAPALAAHLRPMRAAPGLLGHLHAAVFPYKPVPQRTVGVRSLVDGLLERHGVRAVLHLLADGRPGAGAGESTFLRGLVWAAPLAEPVVEGAA